MVADEWEECPVCSGTEGYMEGDDWVDCPHCEGQGGWTVDSNQQPSGTVTPKE